MMERAGHLSDTACHGQQLRSKRACPAVVAHDKQG